MLGIRQTLYTLITSDELNEKLAAGARLVYASRPSNEKGLWDVVLETEADADDPRLLILNFLASVDPGQLENKMLENPSLDAGPGKVALAALAEMVTGAPA